MKDIQIPGPGGRGDSRICFDFKGVSIPLEAEFAAADFAGFSKAQCCVREQGHNIASAIGKLNPNHRATYSAAAIGGVAFQLSVYLDLGIKQLDRDIFQAKVAGGGAGGLQSTGAFGVDGNVLDDTLAGAGVDHQLQGQGVALV